MSFFLLISVLNLARKLYSLNGKIWLLLVRNNRMLSCMIILSMETYNGLKYASLPTVAEVGIVNTINIFRIKRKYMQAAKQN